MMEKELFERIYSADSTCNENDIDIIDGKYVDKRTTIIEDGIFLVKPIQYHSDTQCYTYVCPDCGDFHYIPIRKTYSDFPAGCINRRPRSNMKSIYNGDGTVEKIPAVRIKLDKSVAKNKPKRLSFREFITLCNEHGKDTPTILARDYAGYDLRIPLKKSSMMFNSNSKEEKIDTFRKLFYQGKTYKEIAVEYNLTEKYIAALINNKDK